MCTRSTAARFERLGGDFVFANYPAFAPDGTLYVSDSGTWHRDDGRIVRIDVDGREETISRDRPCFTNGLAVSPDGRWLWLVESHEPRLSRLDLETGECETILRIDGTVLDGLAFTGGGGLLVSCYRPDRIYHFDGNGSLEVVADDPQGTILGAPTNVCFVGAQLDRVVAANLGRWHLTLLDLGLRGAPLPSARPLGRGRMSSFVPRYYEIEQALRARIVELEPGDALPSDAELCEEFAVSRMTARQAVQRLAQEGLLERVPGRGTFVAEPSAHRQAGNLLNFTTEMRRRHRTPASRLLERELRDGDARGGRAPEAEAGRSRRRRAAAAARRRRARGRRDGGRSGPRAPMPSSRRTWSRARCTRACSPPASCRRAAAAPSTPSPQRRPTPRSSTSRRARRSSSSGG